MSCVLSSSITRRRDTIIIPGGTSTGIWTFRIPFPGGSELGLSAVFNEFGMKKCLAKIDDDDDDSDCDLRPTVPCVRT